MTPNRRDADRIVELLSRGWDGTVTDADSQELDALLRRLGPEGVQTVLVASSMHLQLKRQAAISHLFQQTMRAIDDSPSHAANSHAVGAGARQPRPANNRRLSSWRSLAIAASLLLAVGLSFATWPDLPDSHPRAPRLTKLLRPSRPVASVVSVNNAVWAEGNGREVGSTIQENDRLELLFGSAQVSMACGADILLQAPCSVTLVAEDLARLESGKLTAQAAKWATGFSVEASDLKIVDLGTRFALSADHAGVEAHVLEGSVLAEPLKQRRPGESSMLLKSGQAIRVDSIRSKVDLMDATRQNFVDMLTRFRPLRPIPIWNTGVGYEVGADDPHWMIVAGVEEFGPYPRPATITDGDARSYEDNRPDFSQWISVSPTGYPGVPPESTHTFETTFDLNGFDLDSVYVVGYFLVDDAVNEIRINGHPVEYKRWVTTWDVFDFKSFHPIEIKDHFVPGTNVISVDVYNSPSRPETPNDPNPTALRVEWQAFGCAAEE